jgi:hypothetical protein
VLLFKVCLLGLVVGGCSDWGVKQLDDDVGTDTDTDTDVQHSDDEICNGADDDGDGLVDEGYLDSDLDGIADCLDTDCDLSGIAEGPVDIPWACTEVGIGEVIDPWNVGIEWRYASSGWGVMVMPAIGNLTDDNGDGRIDEWDTPDIAFTTYISDTLVALHGDGSGLIFEGFGYAGNSGVSIADVDGDGRPEIIALTTDQRIAAVSGNSTEIWRSAEVSAGKYAQPAIADLNNDGDPEIIFDTAVVQGSTGARLFDLAVPDSVTRYRTPVPADLDADGTLEIVFGEHVFSHTGSLEWSASPGSYSHFAAVADLDGDAGGETFFVSGSKVQVFDDDGTALHSFSVRGENPGVPSIADYDGDGLSEIAVSSGSHISVHELDGTELWYAETSDISGLAGNSGYDINADGQYELLYADEEALRIFDGVTGEVLYENKNHFSQTIFEYPVVADVDNDGSAELVVATNDYGSGTLGITVFGHNGSGWAKSGPTWPTHDFAVTNILPDGTVPSPADLSWTTHNLFRARPTVDKPGLPDLIPVLGDVCVASCENGPVKIAWSVQNAGAAYQRSGVELVLYTVGAGETLIERERRILPSIPPGYQLEGQEFYLEPAQWEFGIVLKVDEPTASSVWGTSRECFEDNNEVSRIEFICE